MQALPTQLTEAAASLVLSPQRAAGLGAQTAGLELRVAAVEALRQAALLVVLAIRPLQRHRRETMEELVRQMTACSDMAAAAAALALLDRRQQTVRLA